MPSFKWLNQSKMTKKLNKLVVWLKQAKIDTGKFSPENHKVSRPLNNKEFLQGNISVIKFKVSYLVLSEKPF